MQDYWLVADQVPVAFLISWKLVFWRKISPFSRLSQVWYSKRETKGRKGEICRYPLNLGGSSMKRETSHLFDYFIQKEWAAPDRGPAPYIHLAWLRDELANKFLQPSKIGDNWDQLGKPWNLATLTDNKPVLTLSLRFTLSSQHQTTFHFFHSQG